MILRLISRKVNSSLKFFKPCRFSDYLSIIRAKNQIGTYLLFFPCAWSTAFACDPGGIPDLYTLSLFAAGSFIMRGAGCIINDISDSKFDKKVERTKARPIASGQMTKKQATSLLFGHLLFGLAVLLQFNYKTIAMALGSVPLFMIYPLMKRFTHWPQLSLGLAINYGALLGFLSVTNLFTPLVCIPLYLAGVCHTLLYDTIYAFQDIKDDKKVGVKSTAILLEHSIKPWLRLFSVLMAACLAAAGHSACLGWHYYSISVGGTLTHLGWQLRAFEGHSPEVCRRLFMSNKWVGVIVLAGIVADKFFE